MSVVSLSQLTAASSSSYHRLNSDSRASGVHQTQRNRWGTIHREIKDLSQTAGRCHMAITTTAVCCLPVSIPCCLCLCCTEVICQSGCLYDKQDENRVPYYPCTSFELKCCDQFCWHGALPPNDYGDMCCRGCDPFVFCSNSNNESMYLTAPQRQRMTDLREEISQITHQSLNDRVRGMVLSTFPNNQPQQQKAEAIHFNLTNFPAEVSQLVAEYAIDEDVEEKKERIVLDRPHSPPQRGAYSSNFHGAMR